MTLSLYSNNGFPVSYLLLLESEVKLLIGAGHRIIQAIISYPDDNYNNRTAKERLLKNERIGPVPKNTLALPMEFKTLDITTHDHSMRIPYFRKIRELFLDR